MKKKSTTISTPAKRQRTSVSSKRPIKVPRQVNSRLTNPGFGFPSVFQTKLKYHQTAQLSSIAGSTANQMNRCNGLFDPDHSGSGHQPLYFDQLMGIYDHFCVIGSKATYHVSHTSASNLVHQVITWLNDDTTTTPSTDALAEQSGAQTVVIPAGSNNRFTMVQTWSAKKVFGVDPLAHSRLQGDATADPTEQTIFQISAFQPGGTTQSVDVEVTIEYIVVFSELKDIAGS